MTTGLLTAFCRHTSCSLLMQENADADVQDRPRRLLPPHRARGHGLDRPPHRRAGRHAGAHQGGADADLDRHSGASTARRRSAPGRASICSSTARGRIGGRSCCISSGSAMDWAALVAYWPFVLGLLATGVVSGVWRACSALAAARSSCRRSRRRCRCWVLATTWCSMSRWRLAGHHHPHRHLSARSHHKRGARRSQDAEALGAVRSSRRRSSAG